MPLEECHDAAAEFAATHNEKKSTDP